jgi:hypothetical protein
LTVKAEDAAFATFDPNAAEGGEATPAEGGDEDAPKKKPRKKAAKKEESTE